MEILTQVLTVAEIARHWRKNPTSVRRAIDSRHNPLVARKADDYAESRALWLISRASVERRWGAPVLPMPSN